MMMKKRFLSTDWHPSTNNQNRIGGQFSFFIYVFTCQSVAWKTFFFHRKICVRFVVLLKSAFLFNFACVWNVAVFVVALCVVVVVVVVVFCCFLFFNPCPVFVWWAHFCCFLLLFRDSFIATVFERKKSFALVMSKLCDLKIISCHYHHANIEHWTKHYPQIHEM